MSATATTTLPIESGTYRLDPNHSGVRFGVRHLGLSDIHGQFRTFDATLTVGPSLADVTVTATIDITSVDTNQPERDSHLLSPAFFGATAHPQMTFRSTAVRNAGDDRYQLHGDLTINGVTKPIALDVAFNGSETSPLDDRLHVGFSATAEVLRIDYGIDFNMPLGAGKWLLGNTVTVHLDMQFVS